jgi:hypothetical protein
MTRVCRHCREPYSARAGRGLCRPCWDDPAIRARYKPLAAFGGAAAAAVWERYKNETDRRGPRGPGGV